MNFFVNFRSDARVITKYYHTLDEYKMSKNNNTRQRQLERSTFRSYQYLFIAAPVATAIAGIVHLYMPLSHPRMLGNLPVAVFFLGSGIAQIFWILPMIFPIS